MSDIAEIDLFVNDDYMFSFGYPINVPKAMRFLTMQLAKTAKHTDDVAQNLGSLIQESLEELPADLSTMSPIEQSQLVFLLCGFLKELCEEADDKLEAGSHYHFKLIMDDEGIVAEMYDVRSVH